MSKYKVEYKTKALKGDKEFEDRPSRDLHIELVIKATRPQRVYKAIQLRLNRLHGEVILITNIKKL